MTDREQPMVYVAGPLGAETSGVSVEAQNRNVRNALQVGKRLMTVGIIPYVPHLNWFWDRLLCPDFSRRDWMSMCLEQVRRCDALLRIPGESSGADEEVALMQALGRRVTVLPVSWNGANSEWWAAYAKITTESFARRSRKR